MSNKRSKKKRTRRRFTSEQKAAILRRHLVDKIPISDLCDEYKLQPSLLYTWQRHIFDNLDRTMDIGSGEQKRQNAREAKLQARVEALEKKLAKKDNVIAEISEEYVKLKKELGEL